MCLIIRNNKNRLLSLPTIISCISILLLLFDYFNNNQFYAVLALDNDLALRPPMGWLSWTRFMCQINCDKYPKECISQNLFTDMANVMVKEGYRDAGYVHVNIDDCWMSRSRDSQGRLVPDEKRFPKGISWLSDYMHSRGLKLGIYENYGVNTCMGFPGTQDHHMEIDAKTFASWNVDMFKFDGCFNDPTKLDAVYPEMGRHLNATGRKIVYSCSWPYYIRTELKKQPNYESIRKHCNLWRNFDDIQRHWKSIESIIKFYDKNQDELSQYHGPGHWNDPDMIIIGNPELTVDQARAQMAVWSIWSAPLLMSNDLRDVKPEFKEILLNSKVIAIDQDPLGIMGKRITQLARGKVSVYAKKLSKKNKEIDEHPYALVFLNLDEHQRLHVTFKLETFDLQFKAGYLIEDLFAVEQQQLPPDSVDGDNDDDDDKVIDEAAEQDAKVKKNEPVRRGQGQGQSAANSLYYYYVQPTDALELDIPPTGVVMWRLEPDDGDPTVLRRKIGGDVIPREVVPDQLYYGERRGGLFGLGIYSWICILSIVVIVYVAVKKFKIVRLTRLYHKRF